MFQILRKRTWMQTGSAMRAIMSQIFNPSQTDIDGDGLGMHATTARRFQTPISDSNHDGSGDACQPTLALLSITEGTRETSTYS